MMSKYRSLSQYVILAIAGVTACTDPVEPAGTSAPPPQTREEAKMSQVSDAVLALDMSAAEIARAQGPAAVPELVQLLNNEDVAVRIIAVTALGEIAHPDAYRALMTAAKVEDSSVASTAADQLLKHGAALGSGRLIQLLQEVNSSAAERILILGIGSLGTPDDARALMDSCASSQDDNVTWACTAALAKLGVAQSKSDFANYLVSDTNLEAFNLSSYIGQPWLLAYLGQLLWVKDPVQSLGDPPPGFPSVLRVCDKAVVLIAEIGQVSFSFPTNVHRNYDDNQLAEVARTMPGV